MTGAPHLLTMHPPADVPPTAHLLFAHGAGAPMTSPFLDLVTQLFCARGLTVTRFEFAYMAARREGGRKRPPPRAELLVDEYVAAVSRLRREGIERPLLIGGKSLGGRVATMCAGELFAAGAIAGVAVLGYPFHPPGKPEQPRVAHLLALSAPVLIVQGERDPFGSRAEVQGYALPRNIQLVYAQDGDHDLGPRGGQGVTRRQNLDAAAEAIAAFAAQLLQIRTTARS